MKVGIVGVGNMGYAFAKALVARQIVSGNSLILIDKNEKALEKAKNEHLGTSTHDFSLLEQCQVILLAVKPQSFAELASEVVPHINQDQMIISIMAGVTISTIKELLKSDKIVRAMPNTPCMLGEGITGYYTGEGISDDQAKIVQLILSSTGDAVEVASEDAIDSVTALSGSGPAYVYLFAQNLIKSGELLGLNSEQSSVLTLQTLKGAIKMMETSNAPIQELIDAVTSKGGTTEAALQNFKNEGFENVIANSLQAAKKRAKELSKNA